MGDFNTCPSCGRLTDNQGWCAWCTPAAGADPYGQLQPPPTGPPQGDPYLLNQEWAPPGNEAARGPRRGNPAVAVLVAVASLVVVAAIGVVGYLLVIGGGHDDATAVQTTQSPTEPDVVPEPAPTQTATVFVTVAPEESATPDGVVGGEVDAEQRLEEERQVALRTLVLDDRWVAELSAKSPGITDPLQTAANGTHVFYFPDILAEHDKLVARFPDVNVMMLRRQDWGKQGRDLWHTVADPGGLASKDDVKVWCARAFPELSGEALTNQCTPRQMTAPHSG